MNEFARVGFNYGSFYYAYILKWQLLRTDKINNYSVIRIQASIYVDANYISWTRGNASLNNISFGLANTYNRGETVVNTQDITVYHDANGNASIYISGSINTTYIMNGTCGGTIWLQPIDRTGPTINLSNASVSENGATFNYSTNSGLDSLQESLNNGNWQSISMNNPIKLTDLKDDTAYTYRIRGKKASNQVWGYSNTISFKTIAGTFVMVSRNNQSFIDAEVYVVDKNGCSKISKDQYEILVGGLD